LCVGKAPKDCFELVNQQVINGKLVTGIASETKLIENLKANCVPLNIVNLTETDYPRFLKERRILMANKMKEYYFSL
jgi:hypothetical protein